jgi:hypothetical protein
MEKLTPKHLKQAAGRAKKLIRPAAAKALVDQIISLL